MEYTTRFVMLGMSEKRHFFSLVPPRPRLFGFHWRLDQSDCELSASNPIMTTNAHPLLKVTRKGLECFVKNLNIQLVRENLRLDQELIDELFLWTVLKKFLLKIRSRIFQFQQPISFQTSYVSWVLHLIFPPHFLCKPGQSSPGAWASTAGADIKAT